MRIKVRYWDNTCGMVDDSLLDEMIRDERISAFLRADGWVIIGRDHTRGRGCDRRRGGSLINIYV